MSWISPGLEYVRAERERQLRDYTPEHDENHPPGALALAGVIVVNEGLARGSVDLSDPCLEPIRWAGELAERHRGTPRLFAIAAALIVAELDRSAAAGGLQDPPGDRLPGPAPEEDEADARTLVEQVDEAEERQEAARLRELLRLVWEATSSDDEGEVVELLADVELVGEIEAALA